VEVQLTITGGKVSKKNIALKVPSTIGRGGDSTLSIAHPMISRHHCKLFENKGLLMIRDMGSLNGTFIDGQRIVEAPLPPSTEFSVGPLTFRVQYRYAGDLDALPAAKLAKPVDADKTGVVAQTSVAAKPATAAKPAEQVKPAAKAVAAAAKPAAPAAKPVAPTAKPATGAPKPAAAKPVIAAKPATAKPVAAAKPASALDDDEMPDFEELADTPALGLVAKRPAANAAKPTASAAGKPASKPAAASANNVKKPPGK
jgi:predicted component of type VI protein secretion system